MEIHTLDSRPEVEDYDRRGELLQRLDLSSAAGLALFTEMPRRGLLGNPYSRSCINSALPDISRVMRDSKSWERSRHLVALHKAAGPRKGRRRLALIREKSAHGRPLKSQLSGAAAAWRSVEY